MLKIAFLLAFFIVLNKRLSFTEAASVSCKDEQGRDVDWFYMYKLPKHYTNNYLENDASGLHYFYITSKEFENWHLSKIGVDEMSSMSALTLQPLFDDPNVLLLAYNDEFPNGTVIFTGGHAKGIVATDGTTGSGIWLIHSVPKFPTIPNYEYPATGANYGQSFLCISLKGSEIDKVGEQLLYNEANIYFARMPLALRKQFPNLEKVIEHKWHTTAPFSNVLEFETYGGTHFRAFAKSSHFEKDLYEDFLAPELKANFLVESWRKGAGNLESNCTLKNKVYNIEQIDEQSLQISFKTTNDHSKWAVSQTTGWKLWRWRIGGSADWFCLGDINRQLHQKQRGGGTVCQKNSKVSNLYRNMISSFEPCNKP